MRLTRSLSSIHSGDISSYISWIIIPLALVVTILVGKLYIPSLLGLILLISTIIVLVIIAVLLA